MLSRKEALGFLETVLKIPHAEMKLEKDRLQLLHDILRASYSVLPYQNLKLLSIDAEDRVAFSPSDYIEDGLKGLGGTCYVLNSFMNTLLKALGYQAHLQGCNVDIYPVVRNQHMVNLVFDVQEKGDVYLVDPGAWCPTFEAVPLHNMNTNTPNYHQSFQECQFIKEDKIITRCHRNSKIQLFVPEEAANNWFRLYHFSLEPIDPKILKDDITKSYAQRTSGCFKGLSFAIFPYNKAIVLKNHKLYEYDDDKGILNVRELLSAEDIAKELAVYCPAITVDLVKKAEANLKIEKEFMKAMKTSSV